jgi:hypothetical protein
MFHELTIKVFADSQSEVDAAGTDWFMPSLPCRFDVITIWLGQRTKGHRQKQNFDAPPGIELRQILGLKVVK